MALATGIFVFGCLLIFADNAAGYFDFGVFLDCGVQSAGQSMYHRDQKPFAFYNYSMVR